jgi:hypothetical protein
MQTGQDSLPAFLRILLWNMLLIKMPLFFWLLNLVAAMRLAEKIEVPLLPSRMLPIILTQSHLLVDPYLRMKE